MKILISADMEGVTGITHWEETDPAHKDYARFRLIMTEEVNSAIAGAAEAGADEIIVTDGHGDGTNILIEELDSRPRLNSGGASPLSMIQGIDENTKGVLFIGYHARAGSLNAVLAHTWSSSRIANVWLNGVLVGETGLNAAVAGHFDVPVLLITGDQVTCSQAVDLLGPVETVVVKKSSGYFSADCLPPKVTKTMIYAAVKRAVQHLVDGNTLSPYIVAKPVTLSVEFRQPEAADRAARLPTAMRFDGLKVEFTVPNMLAAYAGFRSAVKQAYD